MNKRQRLINWLEQIWYGSRPVERTLLLPLSLLFCSAANYRRKKLTKHQYKVDVPVLIVGNLAIGGTGKTPLTIRLAQLLQQQGYQPGIISRGYGAELGKTDVRPVTYQNKPEEVGDEALLMSARTGAPVVVGAQRSGAAEYLLENFAVDIILSDDGLQHYALARDMEIAVIDGSRRFGNGYCLPAGPLREKPQRAQTCDFVVCNGEAAAGEFAMQMNGNWLVSLQDRRVSRPLTELEGRDVHVVTAIGNPQRFIDHLARAGLNCTTHYYPDHYLFAGNEFSFADDLPVLMTEKDAVKCQQFTEGDVENCWYLPIDAQLDTEFEQAFLQKVGELMENG